MEMKKDRVEIPGKRYLIYYTFNNTKKEDNKTQKGQGESMGRGDAGTRRRGEEIGRDAVDAATRGHGEEIERDVVDV